MIGGSPMPATVRRSAWLSGMPERFFRLRPNRLILIYGFVSYGILAALLVSALAFGDTAVHNQVDRRLLASANASAEYVGQILRGRANIVSAFATRATLISALADPQFTAADEAAVNGVLDLLRNAVDGSFNTWVVDPRGLTMAVSPREPTLIGVNFSTRDWYAGIMGGPGPYLSAAYKSAATGHPLVVAAVDRVLTPDGRLVGILGATFDLSRLQAFVDSFAGAQGVNLTITDQTRTTIAQPGGISTLSKSNDPKVGDALHGKGAQADSSTVMAAYAPVPWAGWALMADVPTATALADLQTMRVSVALTAALLALVNLAMVLLLQGAIRRRASAEDGHRRASEYARSLIEASVDPLVTISPAGRITDVNEATVKVTGVARGDLIGTDFSDYFTEPEKARVGYLRAFAEGSVIDYPLTIRNGHPTHVLYNASVFRGTDGKVLGLFAAARDVTAQRRAEEEIKRLNRSLERRVADRTAELEASNRELEAFTYSVSHDLRAPLRAMAGFANLLEAKAAPVLPPEAQQYVHRIDANATKMGNLIDELLRFSRIGRAGMNVNLIDPTAVARAVIDDQRKDAEQAGVKVELSPLPQCEADAGLLAQVYVNLISNAIKFSAGRPGARVEVCAHVEGGQNVFDVRDNGVGFDMRYADKLFGVFQRLHSDSKFQGTGVGLALVQRIVHRHGGRVWAEAEPDKGAAFHFTLGGTRT